RERTSCRGSRDRVRDGCPGTAAMPARCTRARRRADGESQSTEGLHGSLVGYERSPDLVYRRHSANVPCSGGPPPHEPPTSTSPPSSPAPFHCSPVAVIVPAHRFAG